MATYELSGKPILSPTAMRTGGTLIEGIIDDTEDAITLLIPFQGRYVRTGLGDKGGIETRQGHELPITLLLPFKNKKNLAQARTLIFNHLTTNGTQLQPWGTGATKAHGTPPTFALCIRPDISTHPHLYSPQWRMAEVADLQLVYSQEVSHIDGNFLPLIANQAHGATTRPWMMGAYADINTEYSLTEA
jgi:hypothetical protein